MTQPSPMRNGPRSLFTARVMLPTRWGLRPSTALSKTVTRAPRIVPSWMTTPLPMVEPAPISTPAPITTFSRSTASAAIFALG
jgi:hypothetical protein